MGKPSCQTVEAGHRFSLKEGAAWARSLVFPKLKRLPTDIIQVAIHAQRFTDGIRQAPERVIDRLNGPEGDEDHKDADV